MKRLLELSQDGLGSGIWLLKLARDISSSIVREVSNMFFGLICICEVKPLTVNAVWQNKKLYMRFRLLKSTHASEAYQVYLVKVRVE